MDDAFKLKMLAGRGEYVMDKLMLNWEKRLADQCTSTSNIGSSSTVTSAWNVLTSGASDPLGDIWTAIDNVEGLTGYRPNRIVFGGDAWRGFHRHADVIDLINGDSGIVGNASTRLASIEQTKALFEMDEIMVGAAYINTADEGQAMSLTRAWADNVLVYYAPPSASIDKPSFGYAPRWVNGLLPNFSAKTTRNDDEMWEKVDIGYYQDEKITSAPLGFLINAVNCAQ